jgi:hypothetical protein
MPQASFTSVRDFQARHVQDPTAALLGDLRAAVDGTTNRAEHAQLHAVALAAIDSLALDRDTADAAAYEVARICDPLAREPVAAERWELRDELGHRTGQYVSVDQWAATNPEFAAVIESARSAGSNAEAVENVNAALAAREWDYNSVWMLEVWKATELVDDGSLPTELEVRQAEQARVHAEAVAAEPDAQAAAERSALMAGIFAEAVAEAEAAAGDD